jgi:hypothetical protein
MSVRSISEADMMRPFSRKGEEGLNSTGFIMIQNKTAQAVECKDHKDRSISGSAVANKS